MSQNSLILPTTGTLSGLAAVQAINNGFDTLNTLAAGSSAPANTEAGQLWHDTANNLLKIRSLDNTSWISLFSLDEANYLATPPRLTPRLTGLQLSNDATTPNSVVDVAPGGAMDSTGVYFMRLLAPSWAKSLASVWTPGSGNGGLDTGSVAANTGYHKHVIYNPSTKAVDTLFSLSYSAPGLPNGFTGHVAIGAVMTDGSGHIRPFIQNGDRFLYKTDVQDFNGYVNSTNYPQSLSVPSGLSLQALFGATISHVYYSANFWLLFQSALKSPQAASQSNASLGPGYAFAGSNTPAQAAGEFVIDTNAVGQIQVSASSSGGNYFSLALNTHGFIHPRGLQ